MLGKTGFSGNERPQGNTPMKPAPALAGIVVLWFLFSLSTVLLGVFSGDGLQPALLVVASVLLPLVIFCFAYATAVPFRRYILSLPLRWLILAQTVRVIGGVFVVYFFMGLLPGLFAFPAGLGDVTIGLTAPLVALILLSRNPFPKFWVVTWNILGVLDLVTAVTLGILTSQSPLGLFASKIGIQPLLSFPLGLIPAFGVPLTLLLHVIVVILVQTKEGTCPPNAFQITG